MGGEVARVAGAAALGATSGRPSSSWAGPSSRARDQLAGVHARPAAHELGLELDPVDARRDRGEHRLERRQPVGAQVADQLAREPGRR